MISDKRIERAARAVYREFWKEHPDQPEYDKMDKGYLSEWTVLARAALTADAPEIAAAEIRGLEMARKISGDGHFRKNPGTGAGAIAEGILFHMQIVRGEIDARIAELKARPEP